MGTTNRATPVQTDLLRARLEGRLSRRALFGRARALGLGAAATAGLLLMPSAGLARVTEEITEPIDPLRQCLDQCGSDRVDCGANSDVCNDAFITCSRGCLNPGPSGPTIPNNPPKPVPVVGPTR